MGTLQTAIDLSGVEFSDSGLTWLHAMPVGEYKHPFHGKLQFTPERLTRFANNVKNKVRKIEPDIDYDHKQDPAKGKIAAGWVKDAEVRSDGLYIGVQFTDKAKEEIKQGHYKYLSPEIKDSWEDPGTGVKYSDVLFGAGLTNRPFLKDLLPLPDINLSEDYAQTFKEKGRDVGLFESLRSTFGLSENATEDDVAKKLSEQIQKAPITNPPTPVAVPEGTNKGMEALVKTFNERFAELQSKFEEEQRNRRLAEAINQQFDEMKALLESTDEARRKAEVETATKSLSEGKKYALPIPAQNKLRTMLLSENVSTEDVMKLFGEVLETGLVKLGETGSSNGNGSNGGDGDTGTTDPSKLFMEKVEKKMEQDKLSMGAAMNAVALAEPQLYKDYRNDAFIEGEIR